MCSKQIVEDHIQRTGNKPRWFSFSPVNATMVQNAVLSSWLGNVWNMGADPTKLCMLQFHA